MQFCRKTDEVACPHASPTGEPPPRRDAVIGVRLSPYAHTIQIRAAPEMAAISVKGMPMRVKSLVATL